MTWMPWLCRARNEPRHLAVGRWGEARAEAFLREAGFRIRGRRVRVGRRDEFDLIAQDGVQLVFVEVKTRRGEAFGRPVRAVDRAKRVRMSRAALRYLRRLPDPRICFRFDIIEVVGCPEDPPDQVAIRHIANAFPLDRRYMLP